MSRVAIRNLEILRDLAARDPTGPGCRLVLRFLASPAEILEADGRVGAVRVERNRLVQAGSGTIRSEGTGDVDTLEAGLVLRSVGYRGVPIPDVAFDSELHLIPNLAGRVLGQLANGDVDARLHEQLLAQLAELQVSVTAGPVRVVSARVLPDDTQAAIRERTIALCGGSVDVSFNVDESLIAGTRVEFSSQAVDATLADAVTAVRERFGELAPGPDEEADA